MEIKKIFAVIAGVFTSLAGLIAVFLLGKKVGDKPLEKREDIKDGMARAKEDKKNEIEKTDANSLIDQSSDAAGHRSRIAEHQGSFGLDADRAVSDILRGAGSGAVGRSKKDSGKRD